MSDDKIKRCLEHGAEFPYDAGQDFWQDKIEIPPPPTDWAHAAARGVLADLTDRRGIKHELEQVDYDVREELTQTMASIIRHAATNIKEGHDHC